MTAGDGEPGTFAGIVRPFESRVVRQEWAARALAPMLDALEQGERRPRHPVPASAYEESPRALYVYRMRQGSHDHVGVVADVRLDAFASRGVRGHESVEPHRVEALVRYYADVPARAEPVALLNSYSDRATSLVDEACLARPLVHLLAPDGLEHTVWRVSGEARTAELAAALGDGVQYIADGHHRVAARLRAWEEAGRPAGAGVLCVLFPMDGLRLSAFHRRVSGPVEPRFLLDAVSAHFLLRTVSTSDEATGIGLYLDGRWYDLNGPEPRLDGSAGLDVCALQTRVLGPFLGITGEGDPRLEVVPAHLPIQHATSRCDQDRGALFVLSPPSLRTLTRIADLGEVMPPKTTYFSPKPYAGIFLH